MVVHCKKEGVNHKHNHQADHIKAMTDKSKCFDIFQRTKVNNFKMYPDQNSLDFLSYNNDMKSKIKLL